MSIESEIQERKDRGKTVPPPDKETEFNGKILVRVSPVLHEKLVLEAKAAGKSVNAYIKEKLIRN